MPRDISAGMLAPLTSNYIRPTFLVVIKFRSQTIYCWSGVGTINYNGNAYLGVGDFGKIGRIQEGTDVQAYGTTVSLSGIDLVILNECMTDIQIGAPVTIYFALLDGKGAIFGTPYPMFVGTVDKPNINVSTQEVSITLSLETKLANLLRASQRRYTAADQRLYYPSDTIFQWVEWLNDQALRWVA